MQGKYKKASYISSVACSGARILVPSFSLLQKSSSIWTPGYGEAPGATVGEEDHP